MNKEQEKILRRMIDERLRSSIPESARWHMKHRPYGMGEDTGGRKNNEENVKRL